MFNKVLLFFISLQLIGCSVGSKQSITSEYLAFDKQNCSKKADNIYSVYRSEKIDLKLDTIGTIEVIAGENYTNKEILDMLKYEAWKNCANGIVSVPDILKSNVTVKTKKSISCYAVKISQDSAFISKYGNQKDTSFVGRAEAIKAKSPDNQGNPVTRLFLTLGFIVVLIFGIFLVLFALAPRTPGKITKNYFFYTQKK